MAPSRFAALIDQQDEEDGVDEEGDAGQPKAASAAAGPVRGPSALAAADASGAAGITGAAEGHHDDDDDDGFLDAFYHNTKAVRHLGAAAARGAARRRRAREAAAHPVGEEAAAAALGRLRLGEAKDDDDEGEEDEEEEEKYLEEEAEGGDRSAGYPQKRVSKKAERRTQRKQDKAARRTALASAPSASSALDASGEGAFVAVHAAQGKICAAAAASTVGGKVAAVVDGTSADMPQEEELEQGGGSDDEDREEEDGFAKLSKSQRRKQKELERQERRRQCRAEEEAEGGRFTEEAGGVLDARFRRRILQCPAEIAPVPGLRHIWEIAAGFVSGMRGPARFYADEKLALLCLEEISQAGGGFLPAVRQLANVATLPGLMGCSLGMPDIHSGYGFAVGSVAAIDLTKPEAVVSPGGVGFDINCGVRLLRTNLGESEVKAKRLATLATALFEAVPSGVGAEGAALAPRGQQELRAALKSGMRWALERGLCWPEDLERTEEGGAMPDADPDAVSTRALKRGSPQLGTLGSGNHYLELQVVDEIFDKEAADAMGLVQGKICVMIHCGSRGLGHQLCTDYLQTMEAVMKQQGISVPDRQLCCVRASSPQGQQYLRGMAAAANYAFVNRTIIAHSVREAFRKVLGRDPKEDLGMHMVYDVAHNIAKKEEHVDPADGQRKAALVHRKGATRSFPPGHEDLPEVYKSIGQPVLIGGSMGTASYVLAGNARSMELSFGSTCHGAGRRLSRAAAKRMLSAEAVLGKLRSQGIEVRVASPKLVAEEADESYKDVSSVVRTCHEIGISRLVARMRPIAVIKG